MLLGEFAAGSIFGGALLAAGVYAPNVIKEQMVFKSNVMLTVMMGASATSALIFEASDRLGWRSKTHRKPSTLGLFPYDGNLVGGAMIGIGMGATGACPGTVLVQAGTGMLQAALVAGGGILGAHLYLKYRPLIQERRERAESSKPVERRDASANSMEKYVDAPTALRIRQLPFLAAWVCMCVTTASLFYWKDNTVSYIPASGLVPPKYGGLLIGFAQLSTILLTTHTLGASLAYQDIASWLDHKIGREQPSVAKSGNSGPLFTPLFTPSVVFAFGTLCSAAVLGQIAGTAGLLVKPASSLNGSVSALGHVLGGALLLCGARIAGGCTSGHGISGLATFSIASYVTTAAMFSAGIATATALRTLGLLEI